MKNVARKERYLAECTCLSCIVLFLRPFRHGPKNSEGPSTTNNYYIGFIPLNQSSYAVRSIYKMGNAGGGGRRFNLGSVVLLTTVLCLTSRHQNGYNV